MLSLFYTCTHTHTCAVITRRPGSLLLLTHLRTEDWLSSPRTSPRWVDDWVWFYCMLPIWKKQALKVFLVINICFDSLMALWRRRKGLGEREYMYIYPVSRTRPSVLLNITSHCTSQNFFVGPCCPFPFIPAHVIVAVFSLFSAVGVPQRPWGVFEALHSGVWQCQYQAGSVTAVTGQQRWLPDGPPRAGEVRRLQCPCTTELYCTTAG